MNCGGLEELPENVHSPSTALLLLRALFMTLQKLAGHQINFGKILYYNDEINKEFS